MKLADHPLPPLFCEGCIFFNPEGWSTFTARGVPIPGGKCRQYDSYNHDAAKTLCGGRFKRLTAEVEGKPE